MESRRRSWHYRPGLLAAVVTTGLAGSSYLYFHEPTRSGFYPVCPLHSLTGLECPGCGATRALYQLLHGHAGAAMGYNAFFVLLLPWVGYAFACYASRVLRPETPLAWKFSARAGWLLVAAFLLFGVLRNLPVYPFSLLAPHAL